MLMRNGNMAYLVFAIEQRSSRTNNATMMGSNNNRNMLFLTDLHNLCFMAMGMNHIGTYLDNQRFKSVYSITPNLIQHRAFIVSRLNSTIFVHKRDYLHRISLSYHLIDNILYINLPSTICGKEVTPTMPFEEFVSYISITTNRSCRISCHYSIIWNIFCNNRACPYNNVIPYRYISKTAYISPKINIIQYSRDL